VRRSPVTQRKAAADIPFPEHSQPDKWSFVHFLAQGSHQNPKHANMFESERDPVLDHSTPDSKHKDTREESDDQHQKDCGQELGKTFQIQLHQLCRHSADQTRQQHNHQPDVFGPVGKRPSNADHDKVGQYNAGLDIGEFVLWGDQLVVENQ
jgi:hypothetical protein